MLASLAVATAAIFHGTPAEAPWYASLSDADHFCGGALIAPDRVMTAAHCVQGERPDAYEIRIANHVVSARGAYFPRRFRIIPSPVAPDDYYASATVHDIAVIVLREPITDVAPLPLATAATADGTPSTTIGRGSTGPDEGPSPTPLAAAQQVLPAATCRELFGARLHHRAYHLCTRDPSSKKSQACPGDSGSPVLVNGAAVGVVAWGGETLRRDCGEGPADVAERTLVHLALLTGPPPRRFAPYSAGDVRIDSRGRCRRGAWHPAGARFTIRYVRRGSGRACVVTARTSGGWAASESVNAG